MRELNKLARHCVKIGSGATPRGGKDAYLQSGPYSLIRSQNVYNDRFSLSGLAFISKEQADALSNVEVMQGDVLVNITGDSVARVCQVDPVVLPARVNQHVAIVRPNNKTLDSTFLRYWFVTRETQNHLLALASAGATRPALTKAMLENLTVPDVGIDDQRAIAAVLSALDDKIEINRRMNETLEASARALFRDWFVDFGPTRAKMAGAGPYLAPDLWSLFPATLDAEGKPEGWRDGVFSDIAKAVNRKADPNEIDAETPYIGLEHMPRQSVALDQWEGAGKVSSAKSSFQAGHILFGKLRPYFHKVGIAPVSGICSTDIVVMEARRPELAALALACASTQEFVAYSDQSSTGTKMPRTSWSIMGTYPMVQADKPVNVAFEKLVGPMIETIRGNIHESRTLAETRDALLPKLMSGEIRVAQNGADMSMLP